PVPRDDLAADGRHRRGRRCHHLDGASAVIGGPGGADGMAALTIFPTPVPAYRRPPRPGMDERERLLIRCLEANARARELVDLTAVLRTELVERRLELQAGRTECRSLVDQLLNGRLRIVPDGRGPSPRRSHA